MENIAEISDRVQYLIDYLRLNKNEFSKKLGYNRAQAIYDITNGKANPSFDFFHRFMNSEFSAYINIEWLLTGKGELFKESLNDKLLMEPSGNHDAPKNHLEEKERAIMFLKDNLKDKDELIELKNEKIKLIEKELNAMKSKCQRSEETR